MNNDESNDVVVETPKAKELPSLDLAAARYKQEIAKLSKRELVRQNAYYYARLTLANLELNDMESQIKNLNSELTELKQSKESHG